MRGLLSVGSGSQFRLPGLPSDCFYVLLDNQKKKTRSTASCGHGGSLPERVWQGEHVVDTSLCTWLFRVPPWSQSQFPVCSGPFTKNTSWYLMCKSGFCSAGMPRLLSSGIAETAVTLSSCHHCCERGLHPLLCLPAVSFWSQLSGSPLYLIHINSKKIQMPVPSC